MIRVLVLIFACAIGGKAVAAPAWIKSEMPPALGFLVLQCDFARILFRHCLS